MFAIKNFTNSSKLGTLPPLSSVLGLITSCSIQKVKGGISAPSSINSVNKGEYSVNLRFSIYISDSAYKEGKESLDELNFNTSFDTFPTENMLEDFIKSKIPNETSAVK
jgi:hypothetical protein